MTARIFKPAKNAMQSGWGNTQKWVLEFAPAERRQMDVLMGWISSGDTSRQLRLEFNSREEAIEYVEREGIAYQIIEPKERIIRPKAYADNFRADRKENWTH